MSITKIAKSVMEVTADYQKLSDLNVAFYNQDINTSILQFNVTRNDAVVPLGKSNVDGYIVLLHEDGSRIQDNLEIVNEEHGVIQYTIPREFLKHTGKVLGQVYIAVKGRDDTAVMRKISFDIKQDLLTGFSSTKKLEYIKTFDDLQTQIKQRVKAIEEAIANGEDYVAQMVETLDTGEKEIAATVSKANTDINKVANDAKKNVTATADTATKDIASKATKATTDIDKAVSDGHKNITDTSNAAVATVTSKAKEVTDAIADGGAVKTSDTTNWQKDKIWNDDGTIIQKTGYDLLNTTDLKSANLYVVSPINTPEKAEISGYFKRNLRSGGYAEVFFSPFSKNVVYRNAYNAGTSSWLGWVQLANQADVTALKGTNTGWLPLTLLNGVTASTTCYYRFFSTNGIYYLSLKGVLNTIATPNTVIAKLPVTVTAQLDRSLTWVGNTSNLASVAKTNRWTISADGNIAFTSSSFGNSGESGTWNPLDITLTF